MTASTTRTPTIALVTGGNKGIGRQIVAGLAERGMTVLLAARDAERGEQAAAEARAAGGDVHAITLDVTDPATAAAAAQRIDERFGRLDVLVNNAGITGNASGTPSLTSPDAMRSVFDTNVFGVLTVTNALLPLLRRSAAPRIVNMSSSVGSMAEMTDPNSPTSELVSATYIPSKTALNALTVQYAKELGKDGFLVNAACPGYCATDLNDHRGYRTAAQGAAVAVRLATLGTDGPTGGFFNEDGPLRW